MPADKLDLMKANKDVYALKKAPYIVDVKPAQYLSIEGQGDPNGDDYQENVEALYGMAFTTKMRHKKSSGQDYTICKMEGNWWVKGDNEKFLDYPREQWLYKMMIRTPDFISQEQVEETREILLGKGKTEKVRNVKLETIHEGLSVQILHIGCYVDEKPSINKMIEYAESQGYEFHGCHREIYISDPRKTPDEKLKTILRHPVKKV